MPWYRKGTNITIRGSLETLSGCATINDTAPTSERPDPDYAGDTEIWWDEQRTVMSGGEIIYVDDDGQTVARSEIEWRESDIEEKEPRFTVWGSDANGTVLNGGGYPPFHVFDAERGACLPGKFREHNVAMTAARMLEAASE